MGQEDNELGFDPELDETPERDIEEGGVKEPTELDENQEQDQTTSEEDEFIQKRFGGDHKKLTKSYRELEGKLTKTSQERAREIQLLEEIRLENALLKHKMELASKDKEDTYDPEKFLEEFVADPKTQLSKMLAEFNERNRSQEHHSTLVEQQHAVATKAAVSNALESVFEEEGFNQYANNDEIKSRAIDLLSENEMLRALVENITPENFSSVDLNKYYKHVLQSATQMALGEMQLGRKSVREEEKQKAKASQIAKQKGNVVTPDARQRVLNGRKSDPKTVKDAILKAQGW